MMNRMRTIAATVVVAAATPLFVVSSFAQSDSLKLAQFDRNQPRIEIGPGGVTVGPKRRPRCHTVTITEERPDGRKITRRERRCDDDERIDRR